MPVPDPGRSAGTRYDRFGHLVGVFGLAFSIASLWLCMRGCSTGWSRPADRGRAGDFATAVGITPANIAGLKNGRIRGKRFTTLDAICRVLGCQPGDILRWTADPPECRDRSEAGRP